MDLRLTEEQNILGDMVRNLCTDFCDTKVVRAAERDPKGIDERLWQQLSDTGILGALIPENLGGLGLSMIEGAIIYKELGRVLAPGPYFVSSIMGANAIAKAGSQQQQALLPEIGSGSLIVTPAWLEPDNSFEAKGVQMRAEARGDAFVLNGIKRHVQYALDSKLLVLARTGDVDEAVDLFLVDSNAPGVVLEQQQSMAYDTQYKVTFNNVELTAVDRVGEAGSGWSTWHQCMLEGIILLGAWAVGGAEKALDMTVQYSKEREQFDKPLAAFQALAHYMADCAKEVAGADIMVIEAAWNHAQGRSIDRLAPLAKLDACSTFRDTTAKCIQIYGGYGFTMEYDMQLFFRRAKQLQINWWDTRYLEELVAADVLDTEGETVADAFVV
jgi:alkylation response protein AidB-like acyl-CoA dehydrogenase